MQWHRPQLPPPALHQLREPLLRPPPIRPSNNCIPSVKAALPLPALHSAPPPLRSSHPADRNSRLCLASPFGGCTGPAVRFAGRPGSVRVMGEQGSAWLITAGLIVPPDQGAPQPGAGQGLKGQPGKLGTGLRVHPHKGAEGGENCRSLGK